MNYGHPFPDDAPHPGNAVLRRGKGKPLWHKSDHRYGNKCGAADNGFVPSLVGDHQFIRCALLQHTFIALLLRDKLTFKRRQMAGQLRQKGQPFVERHRLEFFFDKKFSRFLLAASFIVGISFLFLLRSASPHKRFLHMRRRPHRFWLHNVKQRLRLHNVLFPHVDPPFPCLPYLIYVCP